MTLPARNTLSFIAEQMAALLNDRVTASPMVVIGPPSEASMNAAGNAAGSPYKLCLFFYRVEPSGFYPETGSNDPFLLRIHCLITAFGKATGRSDGEINLRLLGDVIRVFHEYPVHNWAYDYSFSHPPQELGEIEPPPNQVTVDGSVTLNVQAIFKPMSTEELNQIWSTQGEVTYRTSIAYEFALAPIYPHDIKPETTRVGQIQTAVSPSTNTSEAPTNDGAFSLEFKGLETKTLRKFGNFDASDPRPFKLLDNEDGSENDRVRLTLNPTNMPSLTADADAHKFQLQVYQKLNRKLEAIGDPIDLPSPSLELELTLETPDGTHWSPGTYWLMVETLDEDPVSYSNVLTIEISEFVPSTGADL